jgi:hypothetical protein
VLFGPTVRHAGKFEQCLKGFTKSQVLHSPQNGDALKIAEYPVSPLWGLSILAWETDIPRRWL